MAKEIKSIIFEKYILFTIITLAVILLDQLVKWDIKKRSLNLPGPVIENFLSITNIHNYGASFGMLQNRPALLAWFSIFVVVLIFAFLGRADRKISIFLAMILGGTVSNLVDRISYGYVIDYVDFSFWPAFNIADAALTVGVIVLFVVIWRSEFK